MIFVCLSSGHATIYVIVLETRDIVIASDSKKIWLNDRKVTSSAAVEKVMRLGKGLAFMSSGVTELSGETLSIRPAAIARTCYRRFAETHAVPMKELAAAFASSARDQLNRLSDSEKATAASVAEHLGSKNGQVIESILAGLDSDGILKVETIDFYVSRLAVSDNGSLRFDWTMHEASATKSPRLILSGEVEVLKRGFEDGKSPVRQLPSFAPWEEAMQEGKQVDAVQTAEALVDLSIRYSSDNTRLGYPIYVYRLDVPNGLKTVRIVPRGEAIGLPH